MTVEIRCGNCYLGVIPESDWNTEGGVSCPSCRQPVEVTAFASAYQEPTVRGPEAIADPDESSCYYHAANRASTECDECGRFLCSLCDLEIDGKHLCPPCLERGVAARKLQELDQRRWMPDASAMALALVPLTFVGIGLSIVTAPAALFLVARYFAKRPLSAVPRSRWRFVVAGILSAAQVVGWVALIAYGISESGKGTGSR